ncbi:hypothetical protein [Mesorhizobium sp. B1-1-5]|uniref:hypothetical protein n=1 Tax=Mesorhizobium sp. B1-1-5 TaxID=2589979 RepID=UPI001129868E|nr:hypothetical protein [Mesorhizobium sp. B1-1-5]TPO01477.1 hypothetical protein FJ980_20715 [Mesorhizobium sp. B1-1-5]
MRIGFVAATLAVGFNCIDVTGSFAQAPDYSSLGPASAAWLKCQEFEVKKDVRAYGKDAQPESIADMAFLDCKDLEDAMKRETLGANVDSDAGKALFMQYKIEMHELLSKMVVKLQRQQP